MATVTGDITEITVAHPTYQNKTLKVKKGTDFSYNLGGPRKQDNDDGISGDGEPIYDMQYMPWSLEGEVVWDMNNRDELDYLSKVAASPQEATFTVNCINGAIHGALGSVIGDLVGTNRGVIPVKFSGGGTLKKIG